MNHKEKAPFYAPFYIFLKRGYRKPSDQEILEYLGLQELKQLSTPQKPEQAFNRASLYITECNNWMHIMDNWSYDLWHKIEIYGTLEKLSIAFDIFHFSIGDTDDSFDFFYYESGSLIRKHIVEDPRIGHPRIKDYFGEPFAIEAEAFKQKEPFDKMIPIAQSLGIDTRHELAKIRCYGKKEPKKPKFFFFKREH